MNKRTMETRYNGRHTVKLVEYGGWIRGNAANGFDVEHGRVSVAIFPYPCPTYPDRESAYNAAYRNFAESGKGGV